MGKQIVQTASLFEVDDTFDDPRFMRVTVAAMHSGINLNGSRFSLETIKAAKDTFKNIPVLADVREYTDENGNKKLDYSGHSMHIEDDAFDEEASRMIYDEKVVGIIPETNDFEIVHNDIDDNDFVTVSALLYRDYGNYVCDILKERGGKTAVSMEIACDDTSYSAKDKCLDVGKMTACGLTLLGEHTMPGMKGANAQIFSLDEDNKQEQLIRIMQELKESLDNYTNAVNSAADNSKEGGETKVKLEELLKKYNKTVEDITFETEGLSDEDLEKAFAEAFEEATTTEEEGETPEPEAEVTLAAEEEPETEPEPETDPEPTPEESSVEFTVKNGDTTKTFSVSLNDKLSAFYSLINETYGELDNDCYNVTVFEDEKIVEMYGYFSGKAYRQSYKCKKDNYQLVGDRCEIFSVWMSADERTAFENMKANYSAISEKLEKYESEPQKAEILASAEYKYVADTEEFAKLSEDHFDLSVNEVKEQADNILLSYAKKGALKFSAEGEPENNNIGRKQFTIDSTGSNSRYGNLFRE